MLACYIYSLDIADDISPEGKVLTLDVSESWGMGHSKTRSLLSLKHTYMKSGPLIIQQYAKIVIYYKPQIIVW